jgi:monoamine oxidase
VNHVKPSENKFDVAIIGAGAAGLRAALALRDAGKSVLLLEARDRPGGRIHTLHPAALAAPVELGAEFVHGMPAETFALLERFRLPFGDVTATHRSVQRGGLSDRSDIWETSAAIIASAGKLKRDLSVDSYLERSKPGTKAQREQTRAFIQGFDAADTSEASILQLARDQEHAGEESDRSFRIIGGYGRLIDAMLTAAAPATVHFATPVQRITWRPGEVRIDATHLDRPRRFVATRLIVTVPVGVLAGAGLTFSPELPPATTRAIAHLKMGPVIRLTLGFRRRFWERTAGLLDLGFIHRWDSTFPSFWTQMPLRLPMLTAWAGGNRAMALAGMTLDQRAATACADLAAGLHAAGAKNISEETVRDELADAWCHDWQTDPWARGAYSFVAVDGAGSRERLGKSIANTIWIAGEATVATGESGTVDAALVSGRRAAEEMLRGA